MDRVAAPELHVTVARVTPAAHVATLVGELDAATAPALRRRLQPLARGRSQLIVDLSGVTFADDAAWEVLTTTAKQLRRHGGGLVVATDDPRLRRLLDRPDAALQLERTLFEAVERVVARQYA